MLPLHQKPYLALVFSGVVEQESIFCLLLLSGMKRPKRKRYNEGLQLTTGRTAGGGFGLEDRVSASGHKASGSIPVLVTLVILDVSTR